MAKSIILIGPPGSGKSTIGRAISRKLSISFTDTDQLIEVRAGMSISQIFIDKGEPWFRDLEKEVLKEELSKLSGVLSLGGGAPLSESAPIYEALATHVVKVDERAPKDIVDEIVRLTQ